MSIPRRTLQTNNPLETCNANVTRTDQQQKALPKSHETHRKHDNMQTCLESLGAPKWGGSPHPGYYACTASGLCRGLGSEGRRSRQGCPVGGNDAAWIPNESGLVLLLMIEILHDLVFICMYICIKTPKIYCLGIQRLYQFMQDFYSQHWGLVSGTMSSWRNDSLYICVYMLAANTQHHGA